MVVADETHSLQISGTGDVLEPHDGIIGAFHARLRSRKLAATVHSLRPTDAHPASPAPRAAIGSGGSYALAAARALIDIPGMDAMTIGTHRASRREAHLRSTRAASLLPVQR